MIWISEQVVQGRHDPNRNTQMEPWGRMDIPWLRVLAGVVFLAHKGRESSGCARHGHGHQALSGGEQRSTSLTVDRTGM